VLGEQYAYFVAHNLRCHLLGHRVPLLAGFKITNRCNLRCRVCPFWRKPTDGEMDLAGVAATLDRLHDMGVRLVILEGGEPMLWRDDAGHTIHDVVREARSRFFCVGLTTNGLLPIENETDVTWVSVDGLREAHNANRGPTFDKVLANIDASPHPKLYVNVTINRLNWDGIPDLVRLLADKPTVKGITVQFYYPYEDTDDLWLPRPDRHRVLDNLIALKRQSYPIACSIPTLEALKDNTWRCHPWLIASAEPDGRITHGCYLENRTATIACDRCGFAAHTEISLAYDANVRSINAGRRIFGFR
jgi:MoaA/NifB/PqqE/SkfB family radical SAM enzyme